MAPPPPSYRWLLLLCLAQLFIMLVFINYSAVLPLLKQEWGMNNTMAGSIFSVYQLGYIASGVVLSTLTDRLNTKYIFLVSALWSGVANLLFAAVSGALLIQRGLLALHGCSIEAPGGAAIVCGAAGAGKSTLAGFLLRSRVRVLDDDSGLVVRREIAVARGQPKQVGPARGERSTAGGHCSQRVQPAAGLSGSSRHDPPAGA